MTPFIYESRVVKETTSIINNTDIFSSVLIVALHKDGLNENEQIHHKISVKRIKLLTRRLPKSLVFQIFKYLEFLFKVLLLSLKHKITVLNIHTLALLPLGVFLRFILNAKLVYDTHELETETLNLKGVRKKIAKIIERRLIIYCDKIICVNNSIADWYFINYNLNERPLVILNTPEFFFHKRKHDIFREFFSIDQNNIICLFQGGLVPGRGIEEILSCFTQKKMKGFSIVFLGFGPLESHIISIASDFENIYFHPAVDRSELHKFTSSADIGFNFTDSKCLNHELSLPNKFFEYASSGLAILSSNNSEFKFHIDKYQCGKYIEHVTPNNVYKSLSELTKEDILSFKQNSRKMFEENTWDKQETSLLNLYRNLL